MFQDPNSGSHIEFSCQIRLVFFYLWPFVCFFPFMTLTLLHNTGHLFCRMTLNLYLSGVYSWLDWGYELKRGYHRRVLLSTSFRDGGETWCQYVLLGMLTLITWLIKVVSARFLHCKVTIFLFTKYFETMQISCFCLNLCPLILASLLLLYFSSSFYFLYYFDNN